MVRAVWIDPRVSQKKKLRTRMSCIRLAISISKTLAYILVVYLLL
jgi:hypothetical protein